ncbi:MAG TPA: secondary thiamine-phosphate synthase enzyme YjbQ [Spirochaetota bacterium]|jgi:secondary thiamine-phosphate synthase enzyme|nr:secondary thiamine-phosphate synthase enzyme YjbQ [Spirochaetota bacterium]HOM86986.1 secondary thiamine-phosphate synthase enzyme YjbQ [Spirochaetota bacterium]HOR93699.1 secondary thiamine-phosphate synthase enzyme YjbQ [Spirochaetota bacterium]HOT19234.1 secondary thiamine-phosphate synthase enzyme YjbQ [Spirochaetota bacterium]HPD04075.1 secondary thiamine-phosphate synthase enzyme YjbQ [Spirochaetota bacterium]
MATITEYITIATKGQGDIIDITMDAQAIVTNNTINNGLLCLFVPGSTAAITTIEYEPGLQKDINIFLETIIPRNAHYNHHDTWHDDNGSSHLRAAMIGASITVPIVQGKLTLGTWQQIVLIECDTRKRDRKIVAQIVYS